MDNVGYAALQIIPSFKGFESKLESGTRGSMVAAGAKGGTAYGDAAGKSAGSRFNRIFVGAAKVGLAGAVGAGALAFKLGKDAIAQASDLNESLNAVNVTYDKQAAAVKKLGRDAADALGLSNTEFNGLAVQFSNFATQVAGGDGPKVVKILDDLTTRGSDFASVMNLDVNEAMTLFQSGLAGETEPLRRFGIDMSAARVEAFAYANGIAKTGEELTESQKVQARYKLLMEQTAKTQGDFANTSDQLANSQRILSARWDNAQAKLGKALLPVMTDLVNLLIDEGVPAVEKFGDWFSDKGIGYLEKFGGYAKDAAGFVKDLVGFINDIPNSAKLAGLATVLGGGAALKIRGGAGGLLGGAGSALGLAKPVPVFVTNPGFDGPGGAAGGKKGSVLGAAGTGAGIGLGAGAAAVLGTFGIHALSNKLAPAQTSQGNFGSQGGQAQGLANAKGDLLDMSRTAESSAAKITSVFGSVLSEAVSSSSAVLDAYSQLPAKVQTEIRTNGVPESMAQARGLVKQYNLTPKEKRTLFQMIGGDEAKARTQSLITQYNATPKEKRTLFALTGYDTLQSQIRNINSSLDYASRDRRTQITIAYSRTGLDTKGGIQRAAGGPIIGPGTGTSDSIPAWLSNGEHVWTAREVANAGGHGAIEALRRRFRYADGGQVGRSSTPTVNVGDTQVRVFIGEREITNIVRSEMASADRFDRRLRDRD